MKISVILNGKEIKANAGQTILEVATENNVKIPTLCHDEELKPFGSCWVCAVKVKNRRGFVTACGTQVVEGMDIVTDSEDVIKARKLALELLLSDHYADCVAPCKIACPNHVDVQTYVSLIANGEYHEAVKVIKETLPMPLSIGRVCPAFCEQDCRRQLIDDPIAIRQLKRYAADLDLEDEMSYVPPKEKSNGKKIVIVGAGPSGLTCGYYLSNKGYSVTVLESAPKAGGWLRYGIPEYRLPKSILDKEIKLMCKNGMKIKYGVEVGKDLTLNDLSRQYDAVYLAIGAQNAVPFKAKDSDLIGCYLGVDFLKDIALGKKVEVTKKTAIIGGGNTAIDCARLARRRGADVTIIYRRTRKEMPAEVAEIHGAEEEGIKFHFLTNPVEFLGKDGKLRSLKLEKMKLGEADESGRRRPQPTGEFFEEEFGTVIAAISQIPEVECFSRDENKVEGKMLPLSRYSTAVADPESQYTFLANIFAGGDFRRGPATAIEAIADGRMAADSIDRFLLGKPLIEPIKEFNSQKEKKLADIDPKIYEDYEKIPRFQMPELEPEIRATNCDEIELGFDDETAIEEASRCLECGCVVNETCKLRQYATEYQIDVDLFMGKKNQHPIDNSHPFILRDANKCIKCGRCVRICTEVQGPGVLGYIFRGFASYVAPEFGESLLQTSCEACGKCIEVCPVGALTAKNFNYKMNPHTTETVTQNCGLCGTGCKIEVHTQVDNIVEIKPAGDGFNRRDLCFDGKFGWQIFELASRIISPFQREEDEWFPVEKEVVIDSIIEKLKTASTKKIYVSPTCTLEEIMMMNQVAANIGAEICTLAYQKSFVSKIAETNLMQVKYEDLESANAIVIVGKISHTLKIIARNLQRKGKKLIMITDEKNEFTQFADELLNDFPIQDTLEKILDSYYENEEKNEDQAEEEEKQTDAIKLDLPEKTIFIYCRNHVNELVIWRTWTLAAMVCDFDTGSGVLPTSQLNNFRGLIKLGIKPGKPVNSDFVILYGELPCEDQKKLMKNSKFILSVNTHADSADPAHYILPKPSYLEMTGTTIANDGRICEFKNPKKSGLFDELLNDFQKAGLLDSKETESEYWHKKAVAVTKQKQTKKEMNNQELYDFLDSIETVNFDPTKQASVQRKLIIKMKKMN
ncbi:MAG TPA: FAD-dependent oxidoreductase [Candidatus Cloacimonadota bacterium]|nr:FAD-dependent oxidoreductase [Candidatus Cloacimonadota bacterium]